MAELIGVVASGITIVQVAGQLLSSIEKLRKLYRSMRDIPADLQFTLKDIETIGQIFSQVQAFDESCFSGQVLSFLNASLEDCQAAASALETFVNRAFLPLNAERKLRPIYLLKSVFKKEEIRELKVRLESAKSSLQLALSCYQTTIMHKQLIEMEEISTRLCSFSEETSIDKSEFARIMSKKRKPALMNHLQLYQQRLCYLNRCCCACHEFMTSSGRGWSLRLPSPWGWKACNQATCTNAKKAFLWISLTQLRIPLAVSVSLGLVINSQLVRIAPSLELQRVVRRTSPGFKLLWEVEAGARTDFKSAVDDLRELFKSGKASPRDIDPDGHTWLEKLLSYPWAPGRRQNQFFLFNMLVGMGTQINTQRLLYQSIKWIGEGPHMELQENLIQSGFDVSEIEAPSFAAWPKPCSPDWIALELTEDPFFVNWISENLKLCPGFAGMNPLLEAILIESCDEVKRLLTKTPINNQENLMGQSALHLAVFRPKCLKILVDAGADVNSRDRHGITPLMYAAAMGNSPVTIQLFDSGADPSLEDNLLKGNFLEYAKVRNHWSTIVDVLGHWNDIPDIPKDVRRSWSTLGAKLWVYDHKWDKGLKYFCTLFELGADPNVLIPQSGTGYDAGTETLAHNISRKDIAALEELIAYGFSNFNHINSHGAHAMISIFGKGQVSDPFALKILLDGGSLINHQDQDGYTTLHMVIKQLRKDFAVSFKEPEDREWDFYRRTEVLDCIRILLCKGADPFLRDSCQCACSKGGCTPFHLLLEGTIQVYHNCRANKIWILEYLSILKELKMFEVARQCLLDMFRLVKFYEMELTHTCSRHSDYPYAQKMDYEDIEEIMDEEEEIAQSLEQEIQEREKMVYTQDDLDQTLLSTLFQLCLQLKKKSIEARGRISTRVKSDYGKRYVVDYQRDELRQCICVGADDRSWKGDPVEVIEYAAWVGHEHSRRQRQNEPDLEWYEERIRWINTLQSMNESVKAEFGDATVVESSMIEIVTSCP